ncbi:MAG TPA: hypothetical protein VMG32_14525 [Anaeromyxobacteraceae bacterium]|nr:hypothetical protein [Anaeromyxobacteraceae bacterium]
MTIPSPFRYMAALVALLASAPAQAERVAGALLPDEARAIEPNRYRIDKSFDDTLKFFKTVYPVAKYPRRTIVNQPGLKAVHIDNPDAKPNGWDGLNVYEFGGETRVFVLVAPDDKERRVRPK